MANYVYLKIPRESWALLEETLQKDSESKVFDPELRSAIKTALAEVKQIPFTTIADFFEPSGGLQVLIRKDKEVGQ